jgi:hypothetical protein
MVLAAYGSKAILVDMDVDGPPEFFDWLDRTEDRPETGTNPQTATRPRS